MAYQTVSIADSADIASVALPRTKTSLIFPMVVAAQAVMGISGMHRKDYKKRDYRRKSPKPPWYEAAFCLHGPEEGFRARVRIDSVSVITSLIHLAFDLFTFSDS